METSTSKNDNSLGMAIHLATFLKYIFPFGNFIGPIILWTVNKEKPFVDHHGREAVNFQLSMLLYGMAIGIICLPFVLYYAGDFVALVERLDHAFDYARGSDIRNLSGYITAIFIGAIILLCLFIFELYAVITAATRASAGKEYKYPLSIRFIQTDEVSTPELSSEPTTTETPETTEQDNSSQHE
ncbi:MAG: DUF4870 domain-containing protein [Gilvibacter sp.]